MKKTCPNGSDYNIVPDPLIVGVIIFILLIIISLSAVDSGFDEYVWNYIGHGWAKYGVAPYADAVDNKTPGIFIIFAISNLFFGVNIWFPRLLGILAMVSTSVLLYFLGRRIQNSITGIITMVIFGLTMTWRSVDGPYTAQVESFMVLFTTSAFYLILRASKEEVLSRYILNIFFSGFFLGMAIAFKQVAILSLIALIIFYGDVGCRLLVHRNIARDLLVLLGGVIVATFTSLIPLFISHVTLKDYFRIAWLLLLEGTSSVNSLSLRAHLFYKAWSSIEMMLFYPLLLLFIIHRKKILGKNIPFGGIIFWIFFEFLGVNASGYYWPHHFKQLMPPLALVSGISISMLFEKSFKDRWRITQVLIIIFMLCLPYGSIAQGIQKTVLLYRNGIHENNGGWIQNLADWIKENSRKGEYIYVFDDYAGAILVACDRLSPTRYFVLSHTNNPLAKQEITLDLKNKSPKFIIIPQQHLDEWDSLKGVINQFYHFRIAKEGYDIFEKDQAPF